MLRERESVNSLMPRAVCLDVVESLCPPVLTMILVFFDSSSLEPVSAFLILPNSPFFSFLVVSVIDNVSMTRLDGITKGTRIGLALRILLM